MKRRLPLLAALAVAIARGGARRRFSVHVGRNVIPGRAVATTGETSPTKKILIVRT